MFNIALAVGAPKCHARRQYGWKTAAGRINTTYRMIHLVSLGIISSYTESSPVLEQSFPIPLAESFKMAS
jgi:hypothetical protein